MKLVLQHACTGTSWIEVSYDVFTSYQCGFFPNTNITCWLEAVNEAGNSSQLSKSVITDCDGRLAYSKEIAFNGCGRALLTLWYLFIILGFAHLVTV